MDDDQVQPRIFQEPEILKTRPGPVDSPPPNCAICLGTCTNKCFTDCCLHQFCFSCLLEWSKIKAECPLCKQPFKSIIYNIKSNVEYEEHIIPNPQHDNQDDILSIGDYAYTDPADFLFLPNGPRPQRHFQYRTTFTLEPGGEFAIQQFLLTHPRTNSLAFPTDRYPFMRYNTTHSVDQRRSIYVTNCWVDAQPDITGRYRECTPQFFRENPAQAHRIIPWLNRELSAIINHAQIYRIQQEILDMLCDYPIQSSQFRARIVPHLLHRTDHFIHEFYNFVRSPYDMIGYDRNATYSRHRPPVYNLSDEDSDVHVVDSPSNDDCIIVPNRVQEVIVIDSDSSGNDSDVIIRTPTPPPIVDLIDTSTEEEDNTPIAHEQTAVENINRVTENRSPQLPIKIRLKRSISNEILKKIKYKESRRTRSRSSSCSSSASSSYSDESSTSSVNDSASSSFSSDSYSDHKSTSKRKKTRSSKKYKKDEKSSSKSSRHRRKKFKSEMKEKKSKRSSKKSKKQKLKKRSSESSTKTRRFKKFKTEKSDSSTHSSSEDENFAQSDRKPIVFYKIKNETSSVSSEQSNSQSLNTSASSMSPIDYTVRNNINNYIEPALNRSNYEVEVEDLSVAGPSNRPTLRSTVVVKNTNGNLWYGENYPNKHRVCMYPHHLNLSENDSSESD